MSKHQRYPEAQQSIQTQPLEVDLPPAPTPRVYAHSQLIKHDLFKLLPANMIRNVSYSDIPHYEHIEHAHWYHTVDSTGKKLENSSAVGQHFHEMKVVQNKDGIISAECGPASKFVMKTINGRPRKVVEVISHDAHTHEVEYKLSEDIPPRMPNKEWAKAQAQMPAPPSVSGIIER